MSTALRGFWMAFWMLVDSESVRLFVWPYYIALFTWGIYGTFFAAPNTVIEPVMGHVVYNIWVWLCVAGTAAVMVGMVLPTAPGRYIGMWMQFGGHTCMGFVLFAYEYSAIVGTAWGRGSFGIFAIAPYVLGCVFLAIQAGRKIRTALRLSVNLEVAASRCSRRSSPRWPRCR